MIDSEKLCDLLTGQCGFLTAAGKVKVALQRLHYCNRNNFLKLHTFFLLFGSKLM